MKEMLSVSRAVDKPNYICINKKKTGRDCSTYMTAKCLTEYLQPHLECARVPHNFICNRVKVHHM